MVVCLHSVDLYLDAGNGLWHITFHSQHGAHTCILRIPGTVVRWLQYCSWHTALDDSRKLVGSGLIAILVLSDTWGRSIWQLELCLASGLGRSSMSKTKDRWNSKTAHHEPIRLGMEERFSITKYINLSNKTVFGQMTFMTLSQSETSVEDL